MWAHHRTQRTQHPAQQLELNAGPTGSSHARPPNRPPRTGQAAPGRPGSGGAGRGWEWRRPQPAAEPGPGGGGRWPSPEVGVPRAAVDGGRGHACGRALGGAAHTSPRRSPSRLHFLTCLFTSFPLLLSLSLEIQERAERAAWPRRQHQRRLERRPERWTQRLENWISSELSGIQVPQPGDHTVTPAEAAAESARTLDLNGTCSRSLFKRPVFY